MKQNVLQSIVESGVTSDDIPSKRRGIVLSNYVALTLATAAILLFIIIPGNHNIYGFLEMLSAILIFSIPIILNRWHLTNLSKLYECWLPPVCIIWYMSHGMKEMESVPVSSYDGLRFYLLAISCIPFLIFERKNYFLLLCGVLPGFVSIIFCDAILQLLGAGFEEKGVIDLGYEFTNIRAFIAYIIINGICLALKVIVDQGDSLNEKLIFELAQKNRFIQNQSEEKLRFSEHKYSSLFEQASDGLVISDLAGNLTDCNPKASQLLGYSRDELIRLNVADLLDKDQLAEQPIRFDLYAQGQARSSERRMVRKDGSIVEIETNVKKLGDNNLLAIMRDISQRKIIETQLREAEAKFRNLVEQSLAGVYIMVNGRFAYVNPRLAELLEYTQEEMISAENVENILHPDDREKFVENVRSRLAGETESARYEVRGIKKNGEVIWAEVLGTITEYLGQTAIIGTLIDITERKKFEAQQALFTSLVNSAQEAIISQTLDGKITSWNLGAKKLFGYEAEEVIGKHVSLLMATTHLREEDYILKMVRNGEAVENHEAQRIKKNGEVIYVSLTASPVKDVNGVIIGASRIARDITDRKKAEEEKERARYLLNERIKELRTLYDSSQILQDDQSVEEAIQSIVNIMPHGWQYPEIAAARIRIDNHEFKTRNFRVGPHKQEARFNTPAGVEVILELVYLEEKPTESEGPFLSEERDLINMLTDLLRIYLTRKDEADALKKSEASLNAVINNTAFFIWSVNRKYELKNINKPFSNFIKEEFGIEALEGQSISDLYKAGVTLDEFAPGWHHNYRRAMEGESFGLETEYSGRHFKFSLNPIIENETVAGVSVFSEETTELKKKEKELYEANRQIDDLKLMALRAAMNPHFVFNTLNSIQYFIMENDQRNAVSYLSTFSKLIRSILNHSVQNRVKLVEELEMLKHYINLEQMRFENKFDYEIEVDSRLDIENIEIPSMLIQPYVENAILHGINHKTDRGKLKITIKDASESILFEVEDNGIGRRASRLLHENALHQHKSHGTTLTEERLKLINIRRNVSFEVIDLEEGGLPMGTKVKIWIAD